MHIDRAEHLVATDPVHKLLRIASAAHADAIRQRKAMEIVAQTCRTDEGQCRIRLNDLRREIDRLQRSDLARLDRCQHDDDAVCAANSLASPPQRRKAYAVDPLGKPATSQSGPLTPAAKPPPLGQILQHVTNLGSLIDATV